MTTAAADAPVEVITAANTERCTSQHLDGALVSRHMNVQRVTVNMRSESQCKHVRVRRVIL